MSRGTALRRSMAMLIMASGAVLGAPWSGAAEGVLVAVRDSAFAPERVGIAPGDAVVFVRDNSRLTHSITSDDGAFAEQELSGDRRYVGYRFGSPGTYPYHCKYHGAAGGRGMSGVILVGDPAQEPPSSTTTTTERPTTTTTERPTTTTTERPTTTTTERPTTTTEPPTTTTEPPTTTTTQSAPIFTPRPPAPPSALTSDSTAPPKPPTPSSERKKAGARSSTTSTSGRERPAGAAGDDPSTTTTTPAEVPPDVVMPPVELEPGPLVDPTAPAPDSAVQTLDDLALGRLAEEEKPPPRDASGFLVGAGIAGAALLLVGGGWAWYHRASRYLPA